LQLPRELYFIIINCRGYENLKRYIREILCHEDIVNAVKEGLNILIVSADRDKNPSLSIRGLLSSIQLNVIEKDYQELLVNINNEEILVKIVEQGLSEGTMELEDDIEKLAVQQQPKISEAIEILEKIPKKRFNSKQKVGIFEAIMVNNDGLPKLISGLLKEASHQELLDKFSKYIEILFKLN